MRKRMNIILAAEEAFAKSVILGLIVRRPLSAWHFLIPGMFLLQYLKRSSETKKYVMNTLFPKRLAIDAAYEINSGGEREKIIHKINEKVKDWLTSVRLYSENLQYTQIEEIKLYIQHYSKLLNAEGEDYYCLVKNAYKDRSIYEAFLQQLSQAEKEVDRAIIEILGEGIREQLLKEDERIRELREKEISRIFMKHEPEGEIQ